MANSTHDEHLDPTTEISLEAVKNRAVKGVVILTGRTFLLQLLSFAAWFFLSVFLDEVQIGIFFIVSSVVNFLRYFSDIGLAAALIQKKSEVTNVDLKTTFTVQQTLVIFLLVILYFATPFLQRIYGLSYEGKLLLYALGISFMFSSLKTIPSVLLERELKFEKLVIPDVLENLVYNITAVLLAWQGFGIRSFTFAVVSRGFIGLVAIYIIRPWLPGFAFSRKSLKKLLTFGVPYQLNTFLATIKDDGITALLGGILGPAGIGLLGWAQKWSQVPLRLFLDNVTKVTFPAFARMQDDKENLRKSVTRSIFFVAFLVFPTVVGLLILAPFMVEIIPRYDKWRPALLPLTLVSVNVVFATASTQVTNLFNAVGKIKTTFKLMVMWTVLTWLFVPGLGALYGVDGAAAGYAIVGFSSVVAIYVARRIVKFSIKDSLVKPGVAALAMATSMYLLRGIMPVTIYSVWALGALGVVVYAAISYFLVGPSIVVDVKRSIKTLFNG